MKIKKQKPRGAWKKSLISFLIVFGLVLVGFSYWNLLPSPKAFLIKKAFEGGRSFRHWVKKKPYKKQKSLRI